MCTVKRHETYQIYTLVVLVVGLADKPVKVEALEVAGDSGDVLQASGRRRVPRVAGDVADLEAEVALEGARRQRVGHRDGLPAAVGGAVVEVHVVARVGAADVGSGPATSRAIYNGVEQKICAKNHRCSLGQKIT